MGKPWEWWEKTWKYDGKTNNGQIRMNHGKVRENFLEFPWNNRKPPAMVGQVTIPLGGWGIWAGCAVRCAAAGAATLGVLSVGKDVK